MPTGPAELNERNEDVEPTEPTERAERTERTERTRRAGPAGSPTETVAFLAAGDLHTGQIPTERLAALFGTADSVLDARFFAVPGDLTNDGRPEQYALLIRHVRRLPFPFLGVLGNHDVHTGPDAEARARLCKLLGVESASYTRCFGGIPFTFLSTDGHLDGCRVEIERSFGLLEAVLSEGRGPVVLFCHAPLTGTVQCAPGRECFSSDDPAFGLQSSDRVRALVRGSARPVVWISGHTHTPVEAEGLIGTERLGDAILHTVNVSCPYFTGRDMQFDCPVLLYHFRADATGLSVRIEDVGLRETVREEMLPWRLE